MEANNQVGYKNVLQKTKAVFFLGTPHFGCRWSNIGFFFAKLLQIFDANPAILLELELNSPRLRDLHENFANLSANDVRVVNFFEQRKSRVVRPLPWTELVSIGFGFKF